MYSVTNSFGLNGLRGFAVAVEADVSGGLPAFSIVGLPDSAVRHCQLPRGGSFLTKRWCIACLSRTLPFSILALSVIAFAMPHSPFCRCATSSPRPGEVFPQRERPWQYGKVSGFAKGSHFGGAGAKRLRGRALFQKIQKRPLAARAKGL